MYEPILDMAEDHLKKLYKEVLSLTWGAQLGEWGLRLAIVVN
jgi:hypothetical protein